MAVTGAYPPPSSFFPLLKLTVTCQPSSPWCSSWIFLRLLSCSCLSSSLWSLEAHVFVYSIAFAVTNSVELSSQVVLKTATTNSSSCSAHRRIKGICKTVLYGHVTRSYVIRSLVTCTATCSDYVWWKCECGWWSPLMVALEQTGRYEHQWRKCRTGNIILGAIMNRKTSDQLVLSLFVWWCNDDEKTTKLQWIAFKVSLGLLDQSWKSVLGERYQGSVRHTQYDSFSKGHMSWQGSRWHTVCTSLTH